jgi:hypothetical protein
MSSLFSNSLLLAESQSVVDISIHNDWFDVCQLLAVDSLHGLIGSPTPQYFVSPGSHILLRFYVTDAYEDGKLQVRYTSKEEDTCIFDLPTKMEKTGAELMVEVKLIYSHKVIDPFNLKIVYDGKVITTLDWVFLLLEKQIDMKYWNDVKYNIALSYISKGQLIILLHNMIAIGDLQLAELINGYLINNHKITVFEKTASKSYRSSYQEYVMKLFNYGQLTQFSKMDRVLFKSATPFIAYKNPSALGIPQNGSVKFTESTSGSYVGEGALVHEYSSPLGDNYFSTLPRETALITSRIHGGVGGNINEINHEVTSRSFPFTPTNLDSYWTPSINHFYPPMADMKPVGVFPGVNSNADHFLDSKPIGAFTGTNNISSTSVPIMYDKYHNEMKLYNEKGVESLSVLDFNKIDEDNLPKWLNGRSLMSIMSWNADFVVKEIAHKGRMVNHVRFDYPNYHFARFIKSTTEDGAKRKFSNLLFLDLLMKKMIGPNGFRQMAIYALTIMNVQDFFYSQHPVGPHHKIAYRTTVNYRGKSYEEMDDTKNSSLKKAAMSVLMDQFVFNMPVFDALDYDNDIALYQEGHGIEKKPHFVEKIEHFNSDEEFVEASLIDYFDSYGPLVSKNCRSPVNWLKVICKNNKVLLCRLGAYGEKTFNFERLFDDIVNTFKLEKLYPYRFKQ